MAEKIKLTIGVFILIASIGSIYYLNVDDTAYSCDDKNITVVGLCFKLSAVNSDGTKTRCYYNESAPRRYKVCKSGWNKYEEEIIGTVTNIDKLKDRDYISQIRTTDNLAISGKLTKEYIANKKELKIEDDGEVLVDLKLLTPYENKISSSGNDPIALFQSINHSDDWKLFDKMDSYKINDEYKVKSKDYYYQYLVETEKTVCQEISQINNLTKKNETVKSCSNYIQKDWVEFKKAKDLPQGSVFGVFCDDLVEGENIEVVYGIEGFDIYEWASYLVTDIESYYKFDGNDFSDATGTQVDATNGGTTNTTGIIIDGRNFDGDNDKVTLTGNNIAGNPAFSYSLWVYLDAAQTANTAFLSLTNGANTPTTAFLPAFDPSGHVTIALYNSEQVESVLTVGNLAWHQVVITKTSGAPASTTKIYIDGTESTYNNVGGTSIPNYPSVDAILSSGEGWGNYFDGKIDEVGIWSIALNSTAVAHLYDIQKDGYESGQYPFTIDDINCQFSGYVFDESDNAIEGANITIWNQNNISENYADTSDSNGKWDINVTNSTNTYMVGAYFNNTLIGQLKPYVSGTC